MRPRAPRRFASPSRLFSARLALAHIRRRPELSDGVATVCSGPPRPYLALPALILAAVVYFPITRNYFFTDDFLHLYQIANGDVLRFLLSPHGGHLYLVRNAVFAASFALWGTNPAPYFWIVLATHLVNVALLFAVLRSFLGSDRVACVVATLWGACPLHEGTLGWYSVYGHALATTAVLGILWDCGRTVGPGRPPGTLRVLVWALVALLGSGCFGTGIGVALVLPIVLGLLRPAVYARWPARIVLGLLPALVVVIYTRLPDLYMRLYPDVQYVNHEIALARGGGLAPVTTMVVHLLGGGLTALLLGFAFRPDDYPGPGTFVLASLAGIGLLLTCFRAAPARRGQLLAFLLVALASYGMVAMGRAV